MTNIGRVGIVMKGNYNSASTYEVLDAVTYNNALYVAKQNVPAGTVPTNTTYWQLAIDASNFWHEDTYNIGATGYESKVVLKKTGNIVNVEIRNLILSAGLPAGQQVIIGTVPSGLRPPQNFPYFAILTTGGFGNPGIVTISSTGDIYLYNNAGNPETIGYVSLSMTYML